jgi:hypothetical protein
MLGVVSEVELADGDAGVAVDLGRQAVASASRGDWALLNAEARMALARALALTGNLAEASATATEALQLYERKGYVPGAEAAGALVRSFG